MNYNVSAYATYLIIAIPVTIWVGQTLFRNGRLFLVDIFHANVELADAVNKLLLTGFYLLTIGYTVMLLRIDAILGTAQSIFEVVSYKVGGILLLLGVIHLLNLYVLFRLRKKTITDQSMG